MIDLAQLVAGIAALAIYAGLYARDALRRRQERQ